MSAAPVKRVALVNPLRAALGHYERSTAEVLAALGVHVTAYGISEPSASGEPGARWLARYANTVRLAARTKPDVLLSLWPVLGYLDFPLLRAPGAGRRALILHDPDPLVHARGYGAAARRLASAGPVGASAIVHTESAREVVAGAASLAELEVVLHPTVAPGSGPVAAVDGRTVVRVMGQYKADRDLDAMRAFARDCPADWALEIVGRGWPQVEGWASEDRFVPEEEFHELTATASVVLIPYRRFFQSGVAIRCLEAGVPVVGPGGTSLDELFGSPEHPWLVHGDDWLRAARHAVDHRAEATERHRDYHRRVLTSWAGWLADGSRRA